MIISYIGNVLLSHAFLYQALLALHLIGLAIGLGGAGITDITFFKAIRLGDRITPETVNWMHGLSQVVWTGIGLLALSGLGLFLLNPVRYLESPGFLAKMLIVAILVINGVFLNFYATARLTTFNFSDKYKWRGAAWRARKLSFIFGAVSATSWYGAFFIAMFKETVNVSFTVYMGIYLCALIGAITFSLLLEWKIASRYSHARQTPTAAHPLPIENYLSDTPAPLPPQTTVRPQSVAANPPNPVAPAITPSPGQPAAPPPAPLQPDPPNTVDPQEQA